MKMKKMIEKKTNEKTEEFFKIKILFYFGKLSKKRYKILNPRKKVRNKDNWQKT